jgi:hypothetical protein
MSEPRAIASTLSHLESVRIRELKSIYLTEAAPPVATQTLGGEG